MVPLFDNKRYVATQLALPQMIRNYIRRICVPKREGGHMSRRRHTFHHISHTVDQEISQVAFYRRQDLDDA